MENGPVEDVFRIENRDFPASHVSLLEGNANRHFIEYME